MSCAVFAAPIAGTVEVLRVFQLAAATFLPSDAGGKPVVGIFEWVHPG